MKIKEGYALKNVYAKPKYIIAYIATSDIWILQSRKGIQKQNVAGKAEESECALSEKWWNHKKSCLGQTLSIKAKHAEERSVKLDM